MQNLILLLVLILAGAAKPAASLCCPFLLPNGLEVGDRWTYWWDYPHGPDSLITVVASHELGGQTYFEMSNDGGLYRVDDEKRTWKYDAASESEILYWDIWPDFIPYPEELQDDRDHKEKEAWAREHEYGFYLISNLNGWKDGVYAGPIVARGLPSTFLGIIARFGPFGPEDLDLDRVSHHFPSVWNLVRDTDTWRDFLTDWGTSELYVIELHGVIHLIFSPQVGTIFYSRYMEGFTHAYALKAYERKRVTMVEKTSLGRLKKLLTNLFSDQ